MATTTTSSSVGTLTFASCFTSTYRNYFATIEALQIGTDNKDVNLLFHYGNSNGNDSTNHNYSSIMGDILAPLIQHKKLMVMILN